MLKKILLALVLLVLLVVAGVPAFFYGAYPKLRPAPQMTAPNTPEAIERGRYLAEAMTGCVACHSPIDEARPGDFPQAGLEFGGRIWPEGSGFRGRSSHPTSAPIRRPASASGPMARWCAPFARASAATAGRSSR